MIDTYYKLNHDAYRADLFRYCIVYVYGGCYFDSSHVAVDSLISAFNPEVTFFSTTDDDIGYIKVNTAVFCSVPGHEILRLTLTSIIRNVSISNYG